MLRLALRCAYASNGGNSLEALNTIYTSLPERDASAVGKVREDKAYLDLQDSADEMDKHLTASEILDRYRLSKPLSFFKAAGDNPDACKAILKSMCRQLVRQVDLHGPPHRLAWLSPEIDEYAKMHPELLRQPGKFSLPSEHKKIET